MAQVEDGSVNDLGDTVGIKDVGDSDRNLWRGCWNLDVIAWLANWATPSEEMIDFLQYWLNGSVANLPL